MWCIFYSYSNQMDIYIKKKGDADFDEIVKFEGYKDKIMKELRNKIFRPNIKTLKIKS